MSSHNNNTSGLINSACGQQNPVNHRNTGRAINYASYLASLPRYNDNTSWEGELIARYGHATHVRIQQERGRHPRWYMPPEQWWYDLATKIRRLGYHQDWYTNLGLPPDDMVDQLQFNNIVELCQQHLRGGDSAYCFGFFVLNSLPSSLSPEHAEAILFSTMAIELVRYGMAAFTDEAWINSSMPILNHYLSMAHQCYELAAPFFSTSRPNNVISPLSPVGAMPCRQADRFRVILNIRLPFHGGNSPVLAWPARGGG